MQICNCCSFLCVLETTILHRFHTKQPRSRKMTPRERDICLSLPPLGYMNWLVQTWPNNGTDPICSVVNGVHWVYAICEYISTYECRVYFLLHEFTLRRRSLLAWKPLFEFTEFCQSFDISDQKAGRTENEDSLVGRLHSAAGMLKGECLFSHSTMKMRSMKTKKLS